MGSCPLNCGAERLMTLTFWELNDCVQWYSVSLDSRCFATVSHSWWTSCSESGFIRAAFSSWDSELLSDAILSVTVVGGGVAVDKVLPPLARSVTRNYCFMYLWIKVIIFNYMLAFTCWYSCETCAFPSFCIPALSCTLTPLPASSCSWSLLLRLA